MARIRAGDERAFDALYERYRDPLLSFCRSMLGCPQEAQDATQQVFANAYRDLVESDKELEVKPWLYAIARNHCISILRSRRPESPEVEDVRSDPGADHPAEGRQEVRDVLQDVGALPERQRAAVVMATLGGFSHAEIATAIGCETEQVKAILFRARAALSERAEAREVSCSEIREQLEVLRGGSLRRNRIRLHLESCESCRRHREAIRRERVATGAAFAAPLAFNPAVVAKGLLTKLGVIGAGIREQGVAQLAAVALATGVGAVGVATVAPDTNASPSPASGISAAAHSETVETRSAADRSPLVMAQPDLQGESAAGGGSVSPLSDFLVGLLGPEGLDLSGLLGRDGLLQLSGVLNVGEGGGGVLGLGAHGDAPAPTTKSSGSTGGTGGGGDDDPHSQGQSGPHGGSYSGGGSSRGADDRRGGFRSLFGGGCHDRDRD